MDVKEVTNSRVVQDSKPTEQSQETKIRRSSEALTSVSVPLQSAQVEVSSSQKQNSRTELRAKINDIINISNVASEATSQISKLVKSIDGIAEQAKSDDISPQRRNILEQEANELVQEIKKTANTASSNGVKPLAGDKIRLEVEERIGKTLDVILPDEAKDAFGLGEIKFSTKDAIISTITSVQAALQNINDLREAVSQTTKHIEDTAASVDVAIQNSEASEASIRDLDEALRVANDTRSVISNEPEKALTSVGKLSQRSLGLLE